MNSLKNDIGFIGAGNMAGALIAGLINGGLDPKEIIASSPEDSHLLALDTEFGIKTTKDNLEIGRARLALASISKFIELIDVESPDLENPAVNQMYEITKIKYTPGKQKNSRLELKSIEEGGLSYWSEKTHRWITGKYDSKNKIFIPPKQNL